MLVLMRQYFIGRTNARVQIYYLILIFLFFFSAFRWEVGCDWMGYLHHWWLYSEFGVNIVLLNEPLWWLLIQLIQWTGLPYPWLNVASSLIFFIGIHALASRQKDPLGFLIILFPILIINMPMSGIRQGAAIGVLCFSFCAFQDKKPFRAFIWISLASLFHFSAFLFFSILPLISGNNLKRRIFIVCLLFIPSMYFIILMTGLQDAIANRFNHSGPDAHGAVFRVMLLFITAIFYLLIMRKKWKKLSPEISRLATLSSFAMLLTLPLALISSMVGDRVSYFLIPLQAMILSNIPFLPIRQYRPIYSIAPYLLLGFTFLIWTSYSWHFNQCYVPYKTWILGFPPEIRAW